MDERAAFSDYLRVGDWLVWRTTAVSREATSTPMDGYEVLLTTDVTTSIYDEDLHLKTIARWFLPAVSTNMIEFVNLFLAKFDVAESCGAFNAEILRSMSADSRALFENAYHLHCPGGHRNGAGKRRRKQ